MIKNINEYNVELSKLQRSFWDEYCKAGPKRSWDSLTRQSKDSQNDIVRKYANRFSMLISLAEMCGVVVDSPGDSGETVTLTVPAESNPLLEGE